MKRIRILKDICVLLAALVAVQAVVISARALDGLASEDPEHIPAESAVYAATAPVEQTVPTEQTVPVETVAEETLPEQTIPAETIAEETVPAETVPEETEAEDTPAESIDEIPLYYQTDYPNELYGSGTVASSGCSITSLAMVATYLTEHVYMPDELADYFGGYAENNIARLEYASEALQLPYESGLNFHQTINALKEGKVAIALMNADSIFTESQHFIVLAGYNEDGKIIVLDPYEPNYSHWQLKNAFENGFAEGDVCAGFSGGWVYDKSEMPEDPFIYVEEKVEVECRYPDIELTYEQKKLLASMVWVEAQGESAEGQQAVAEVVLNRMAADNFPDTLKGVIFAEGQFRSTPYLEDAEPTQAQYEAVERALEGPYVLPMDVVFFATYAVNENVWGRIGGHVFCYQW